MKRKAFTPLEKITIGSARKKFFNGIRGRNFLTGFTLVEVIVSVGIIAILAKFVVPNVLKAKSASKEAIARSSLKVLATASETYAMVTGDYPLSETALQSATPPYLNSSYCGSTTTGYSYACTFSAGGYTVVATPVPGGAAGTTTFTLLTGGVLSP